MDAGPGHRPGGRWRHSITSDDSRRIVLFGGLSQFAPFGGPIGGGLLGDTWSSVVQEDAIYVSPSGNDADPGTRQSPFVTIAAAVAAAAGTGREVRVAAGSYDQGAGLVVPDDIAILGGYDPVTWVRSATSVTQLVGVPQAVPAHGATNVTLDELTLNAFAAGGSVYGIRAVNGSSVRLINVSVTAGDGTLGPVGIAGSPGIGPKRPTWWARDLRRRHSRYGRSGGSSPIGRSGATGGAGGKPGGGSVNGELGSQAPGGGVGGAGGPAGANGQGQPGSNGGLEVRVRVAQSE